METHFHEMLQDLKKMLIEMSTAVDTAITKSIDSLTERNNALAEEVIRMDDEINQYEIRIDEQCLKLLALHQPMAVDLRFITSAMKINNDLERMGDHAVNIAECAVELNRLKQLKPLLIIPRMAEIAQSMVRDSLNCFINSNVEKARSVCIRDNEVDQHDDELFRELLTYMMEDPTTISRAMNLVLVSKNIERIADLSTNIAEEVIFIFEAKNIKHHSEDKQ